MNGRVGHKTKNLLLLYNNKLLLLLYNINRGLSSASGHTQLSTLLSPPLWSWGPCHHTHHDKQPATHSRYTARVALQLLRMHQGCVQNVFKM